MTVEMKIEPREDGEGINITFTGSENDHPTEGQNLIKAYAAARSHFKKKANQLSGGGTNGPDGSWEMWWSFYPDGYKFPPRTD